MYNISVAGNNKEVSNNSKISSNKTSATERWIFYMNRNEILNGLWTITKEKQDACKADVALLDKTHPTERGALQLKAGIYNVAIAAGLITGGEQAAELMSRRWKDLIKHFPDIADYYHGLPQDQKGVMEVSLYPEMYMKIYFYNTYCTDLEQAEREGNPQKIFQARIKKEVLEDILHMWREFRVQHGLFTFALQASAFDELYCEEKK